MVVQWISYGTWQEGELYIEQYKNCDHSSFTQGFATDVCVPISKLPQVLLETKEDLAASEFMGILTIATSGFCIQ